jgi:hypothetical protein
VKLKSASATAPPAAVMSTEELARFLRCSTQMLEILRCKGGGPPYAKIGKLVRYRAESVLAWLAAHEVRSTSDAAP